MTLNNTVPTVGQYCAEEVLRVLPEGDTDTFSLPTLKLFMVIGNRPAGIARIHRKISNFLLFPCATLCSNVIKADNESNYFESSSRVKKLAPSTNV